MGRSSLRLGSDKPLDRIMARTNRQFSSDVPAHGPLRQSLSIKRIISLECKIVNIECKSINWNLKCSAPKAPLPKGGCQRALKRHFDWGILRQAVPYSPKCWANAQHFTANPSEPPKGGPPPFRQGRLSFKFQFAFLLYHFFPLLQPLHACFWVMAGV